MSSTFTVTLTETMKEAVRTYDPQGNAPIEDILTEIIEEAIRNPHIRKSIEEQIAILDKRTAQITARLNSLKDKATTRAK